MKYLSLELFAGAGGLALGIAQAGFSHICCIERNSDCCATLERNQLAPTLEQDIATTKFTSYQGQLSLLSGGPPCQPFSIGGKSLAHHDERNMFPHMLRALQESQPSSFIIENVPGLLRPSFKPYFDDIINSLQNLGYQVSYQLLNAADYGLPQLRKRLFIVGIKQSLQLSYSFPEPTHSLEALVYSQYISQDYWKRHQLACPHHCPYSQEQLHKIEQSYLKNPLAPWRTTRDALSSLKEPSLTPNKLHHVLHLGAKVYKNHTGSPLDLPAKTIKAGAHGVPGGENMLLLDNGQVRYFSVRECARLQGFPDSYSFVGSWSSCVKQIGNAVPVILARAVAYSLYKVLAARS